MILESWNNIRGFVIIEVTGFSVERFVNLAVHRGVYIWDIKYNKNSVLMKISIKGFKALRGIAKKTRCKVKIIKKCGLPFVLNKYRKRKFLAFGLLFFIISLYILSSFVWAIEIKGNENINEIDLIKKIEEYGLKSGSFKPFVKTKEIEKNLLNDFPEISWITIHIKGTRANIKMTEILEKPEIVNREDPCNIIATKDSIITNIVTVKGLPKVKQKDVVKKGDILISGELLINDNLTGEPKSSFVHSDGIVFGKIYYDINFFVPFNYEEKVLTENKKSTYEIKFLDKKINLPFKKIIFENYDLKKNFTQLKLSEDFLLPVIFIKNEYTEIVFEEKKRDLDQTLEVASRMLTNRIIREFPFDADIFDKILDYEKKENGVEIFATIITIEKIGEKSPIDKIIDHNLEEPLSN